MLCFVPGGWGVGGVIEKILQQFQPVKKNLLTDRKVPTLFKQIQRKKIFYREIEFVSISSSFFYLYDFKKRQWWRA